MTEAGSGRGGTARWRAKLTARPASQPVGFVALAALYIWLVRPTGNDWIKGPILAVIVLTPFASNFLHGDTRRDIGLRLDNLVASAREVGLMTFIAAVAVIIIGLGAGHEPAFRRDFATSLVLYPAWGLAQQYAMQSFTYRRLRQATPLPSVAAALAAALFAVLHYPNIALVLVTLAGGYVWCRLFERHPNLITLALSHGWLAVLLRAFWPAAWLHNLRIGPGFWTWTP